MIAIEHDDPTLSQYSCLVVDQTLIHFITQGYSSKRPVGGPGLFITCVRGKEQRCVAEVLDMLDIYANKLYSPERLAAYAALPPTWMLKESNLSTKDPLNLDSLADTLPSDPQQRPEDPLSSDSEEEDPVDESIEDSIARELLALKAARSAGRRNINESGQRDGDAVDSQGTKQVREKRIRPRFMSLETNCECRKLLVFFPALFVSRSTDQFLIFFVVTWIHSRLHRLRETLRSFRNHISYRSRLEGDWGVTYAVYESIVPCSRNLVRQLRSARPMSETNIVVSVTHFR